MTIYVEYYGTQPFGTEIVLLSMDEDRRALVFLSADRKAVVSDIKSYHRANEHGVGDAIDPESPTPLPTTRFSATSPLSSKVYVYYQASATTVGEIEYDVSRRLWSEQPVFISTI
jgi:hypothetical protein